MIQRIELVEDPERQMVPLAEAARLMGRDEATVRRLAEIGFIPARMEFDGLKVEPVILN